MQARLICELKKARSQCCSTVLYASVRFSDLSGVQAHSNLSSEGLQAAVVPLLLS